MKIQLFILVYVLTLSLVFCQEQENVNIEKVLNNQLENGASAENEVIDTMIKEVLKSQLKDGNSIPLGDEYESHDYSEKDLEATISIIENILVSQGYKIPTQSEFKEKIKLKLNRIIDNNSDKKYLYIDLFDKCSRDIVYSRSTIYNGFFIIKNNNFITSLYAIPELIDYQKEYPDLKKIEENQIIKQEPDLELDIEIPRWKDIKDLSQQRRFNQQLLISRNKYLFNDDQSQFSWLINNDEYFMKSLVTTFGYAEDKKLLKWVVENTSYDEKNKDDFGKIFWTKNCNNTISIHTNSFDIINEFSQDRKEKYLIYLLKYLQYILDYENNNPNDLINQISLSQKSEIIAHIINFGEKFRYSENLGKEDPYKFMGWTYLMDYKHLYKKEFEKNNFYNLSQFKERYKKAEEYWSKEVAPLNDGE
ncbi:hypothetical protein [Apibacter adventoris]|uniref:Uncharacterized protein n=1 Tax=Apibacter adventoris TaxID=1679466 RepID=A0A2S8A7M8_9FLAO|nr:hypothetical protein [Apibacter adventoris]PQL90569.1 hypothetical protein C4S77_11870 [Apibacter adventoris]